MMSYLQMCGYIIINCIEHGFVLLTADICQCVGAVAANAELN